MVSGLRLIGQINAWNPAVFGQPEAGGGGALLGISLFAIAVVFGLLFKKRAAA